jgi:hypothetical protein
MLLDNITSGYRNLQTWSDNITIGFWFTLVFSQKKLGWTFRIFLFKVGSQ